VPLLLLLLLYAGCRPLLCCLAFKQHTPETVKQLLAVVRDQELL
jgi:hypothetical protein